MELTKVKEIISAAPHSEDGFAFKPVIKYILSFAGSFLLMNPYVLGEISPFSLSLTAALNGFYSLCSCAGGIFGSFVFFDGVQTLKYSAVNIIFILIKEVVSRFPEIKTSRLFSYLNAFLCTFFIGISIMLATQSNPAEFLTVSYEAILTCTGACIFESASETIWGKHNIFRLSKGETAQIITLSGILLMHLYKYKIFDFSPVITVFFLFILMFSKLKNELGGTLSGICLSAAAGLSGEFGLAALGPAVGGLAAGTLSRKSRHFSALGFFISVLLCSLADGSSTAYMMLPEGLLAGAVFLVIPESFFSSLRVKINSPIGTFASDENNSTVYVRLREASETIGQISDCVSSVRNVLKTPPHEQLKSSLYNAWKQTCSECEHSKDCPEKTKNPSAESIDRIVSALLTDNELNQNVFPNGFPSSCRCFDLLQFQLLHSYSSFTARLGSQGQVSQMQALMSDQFKNISDILKYIADDISDETGINSEAEERCIAEARELGLDILSADIRTERQGKIILSLKIAPDSDFDVFVLTDNLSAACGTVFDYPEINELENYTELLFNQKISFDIKIGAFSRAKDGEEVCGDYYRSFRDKNGRYIVILSDGMGTGARAAVDSAMTTELFSKLVHSGLSFDCALPVINSALLSKSSEESLSTLDAACVNLYSGKAEFFKAGAAVTFIRHRGRVLMLEQESLPLGIISDISFAKAEAHLEKNDIILMVSDGISADSGWLQQELKLWDTEIPAQKLAEYIVESAAERKPADHRDDMTAIAVYII